VAGSDPAQNQPGATVSPWCEESGDRCRWPTKASEDRGGTIPRCAGSWHLYLRTGGHGRGWGARNFRPPTIRAKKGVVSLLKCSFCRQRPMGRPASGYFALFPEAQRRLAYKVKAGPECMDEFAGVLRAFRIDLPYQEDDDTLCRNCALPVSSTYGQVAYLTLYLPKQDSRLFEAILCDGCFAKLQSDLVSWGEVLPNRNVDGSIARASVPAWEALGLQPV
jgi:hypothetical protein